MLAIFGKQNVISKIAKFIYLWNTVSYYQSTNCLVVIDELKIAAYCKNIVIHSFTIDGILRRAVVLHNLFITGLSAATYGTFIRAFFFSCLTEEEQDTG